MSVALDAYDDFIKGKYSVEKFTKFDAADLKAEENFAADVAKLPEAKRQAKEMEGIPSKKADFYRPLRVQYQTAVFDEIKAITAKCKSEQDLSLFIRQEHLLALFYLNKLRAQIGIADMMEPHRTKVVPEFINRSIRYATLNDLIKIIDFLQERWSSFIPKQDHFDLTAWIRAKREEFETPSKLSPNIARSNQQTVEAFTIVTNKIALKLNSLPTIAAKKIYVAEKLKTYKQQQATPVTPSPKADSDESLPVSNEQIINWLNIEMEHLDTLEKIEPAKDNSKQTSAPMSKIKTNLSVPQLGFVFAELQKRGILKFPSKTAAIDFAVQHFSSEKTENVSSKQARKKSYALSTKEMNEVIELFSSLYFDTVNDNKKDSKK